MTKEQLGSVLLAAFHCERPGLSEVKKGLMQVFHNEVERVPAIRALEIASDVALALPKDCPGRASLLGQIRAVAYEEQRRAEVALVAVESISL